MNKHFTTGLLVLLLLASFGLNSQTNLPSALRDFAEVGEWLQLTPQHQQLALDYRAFAEADPEAFGQSNEPCWHGATDRNSAQILESIRENLLAAYAPEADDRYYTLRRWESGSYLATPGNSTQTGDPVTVTWSYIPDGTIIDASCNTSADAPSDLIGFLTTIFGSGPSVPGDLTTAPWHPLFVAAFQEWESQSGLHFVYEPHDDGVLARNAGLYTHHYGQLGVRGDLRIGGRNVDGYGGILACASFPYNGDMVFDTGDGYYQTQVNSDGTVDNAFYNIITHEIGHALGVLHVCPITQGKLMEPYVASAYRGAQHAEHLAANHFYGDAFETGNTSSTAANLSALISTGQTHSFSLSLDAPGDVDHYLLTPTQSGTLSATVNPVGEQYEYGSSCYQLANTHNTQRNADLSLQIFDATTNTLIGSANANGVGSVESLDLPVVAGTPYRIQVNGTFTNPIDDVSSIQLYDLDLLSAVLPVEWVSFAGKNLAPHHNQIHWATGSEWNSDYFEVERSTDGINFTVIGRISAAGNSEGLLEYSFDDHEATEKLLYYRLRQVDTDGSFAYSSLISVESQAEVGIRVMPNPVRAELHFSRGEANRSVRLRTFDARGILVLDQQWAAGATRLSVAVNEIPAGMYTTFSASGEMLRWVKE